MSNKYISQVNNQNFIFPNYDLAEYDVEVIQNINDNSVTGTISSFSVSGTSTTTGITLTYNYTWNKNNADIFIDNSGNLHLLSVHMLAAGQTYYKPWRCVEMVSTGTTIYTAYTGSDTIVVTPSTMGLTTFSSGTYYFEFRFIGLKSIYPVCQTLSITVT
jgi:hypothetical protein